MSFFHQVNAYILGENRRFHSEKPFRIKKRIFSFEYGEFRLSGFTVTQKLDYFYSELSIYTRKISHFAMEKGLPEFKNGYFYSITGKFHPLVG